MKFPACAHTNGQAAMVRALTELLEERRSSTSGRAITAEMRGTQRSFFVISGLALLAVGHPSITHAQFRVLTPAGIAEAIDLGTSEEPYPYVIPRAEGFVPEESVFALAFTPFLRVQFAAHRIWKDTGRRLPPGEIAPSVLAPVVHIAMGRPNEWDSPPCFAEPPRFEVFEKGAGSPLRVWWRDTQAAGIRPLWVKHGLDTLAEYGAVPLDQDGRLQYGPRWPQGRWIVVAYSLEFLRSDLNFFLTHGDGGSGSCISEGTIPSDALATWR